MSMVSGRRTRPRSGPRVTLGVKVLPVARQRAGSIADAAEISQAWYLEHLITRDRVDHTGTPLWAPELPDLENKIRKLQAILDKRSTSEQDALFAGPEGKTPGPRVQLTTLVSPEIHEKASRAASQLWPARRESQQPPIGRYLELLIVKDVLDPTGVPEWLPSLDTPQELPLTG